MAACSGRFRRDTAGSATRCLSSIGPFFPRGWGEPQRSHRLQVFDVSLLFLAAIVSMMS
jgi:hypothetical protein